MEAKTIVKVPPLRDKLNCLSEKGICNDLRQIRVATQTVSPRRGTSFADPPALALAEILPLIAELARTHNCWQMSKLRAAATRRKSQELSSQKSR